MYLRVIKPTKWDQFVPSSLREKCPYSEFFWSVFSRIRIEYEKDSVFSLFSVQMRENADQKNSEYGHFSCSAYHLPKSFFNSLST